MSAAFKVAYSVFCLFLACLVVSFHQHRHFYPLKQDLLSTMAEVMIVQGSKPRMNLESRVVVVACIKWR